MAVHPADLGHKKDPQLWFRPSKRLSRHALVALLECGTITATPRRGRRDETHPKGFSPGQVVTVFVFDEKDEVHFARPARITKLVTRPLKKITGDDLHDARPYDTWQQVQEDLSSFEKRPLSSHEEVTIVHFKF